VHLIGFISGILALYKIDRYPEKYKGRGWSSLAIVLGMFAAIFLYFFIEMMEVSAR
jgi:hypothetical protein